MKFAIALTILLSLTGCAGMVIFPLAPVLVEAGSALAGESPGYTTQGWQWLCDAGGGEWHGGPGAECTGSLFQED